MLRSVLGVVARGLRRDALDALGGAARRRHADVLGEDLVAAVEALLAEPAAEAADEVGDLLAVGEGLEAVAVVMAFARRLTELDSWLVSQASPRCHASRTPAGELGVDPSSENERDDRPAAAGHAWGAVSVPRVTTRTLRSLLENRIAAIVVPDLVGAEDRARLLVRLEKEGATFRMENGVCRRAVGVRLAHHGDSLETYFRRAAKGAAACARVGTAATEDPRKRVVAMLAAGHPAGVVQASDDAGAHASGVYDVVDEAPLDVDFAPRFGRGTGLDDLTEQLTASICLQRGEGCATYVYRPRWVPADMAELRAGGFDEWSLITGVPFVRLPREPGELVITSARNYRATRAAEPGKPTVEFSLSFGFTVPGAPLRVFS